MIHYFNPGHETAVLNQSPYYTPPANVCLMQKELSFLPAWYALPSDVVLIESHDLLFESFVSKNLNMHSRAISPDQLPDYDRQMVVLWGLSPQAVHLFDEYNERLGLNLQLPCWNDRLLYFNSRHSAKDCLLSLANSIDELSDVPIPYFANALTHVEDYLTNVQFRCLAKAPYSSSGRGLLWLPLDGLTRTERQILHGILKKQGAVSIEKVLDKKIDFAMEFVINADCKVCFLGYSLFTTNSKGGYSANIIDSQANIEKQISSYIPSTQLELVKKHLINYISTNQALYYQGYIGVDMLVYLHESGDYKLQPCVEINMRANMGLLSLRFAEQYVAEGSKGFFIIDYSPRSGEIYNKHVTMCTDRNPVFDNNKLVSGYLPLCPVTANNSYHAYAIVEQG